MSHLTHEVCGCDFFVSFTRFNPNVGHFVDYLTDYFKRHKLTFYTNESFDYNQNYMEVLRLQAMRSKVFLFIIDKFSLETELFLYLYQYAKNYSKLNHLPVLIPVIFDNDETKKKLIDKLTGDCYIKFKMSEIDSNETFINLLRDSINDLIPKSTGIIHLKRHDDRFRPTTLFEDDFLKKMKLQEIELLKKMEISSTYLKQIFPSDKITTCLSIHYSDLKTHITTMLNAKFHLTWIDVIQINKQNYFNFLWTPNGECQTIPGYLIFYDLNPAQFESIYKIYCIDDSWNIELIESYKQSNKPSGLLHRRKSKPQVKSNDEIRYIAQIKYDPNTKKNKLQHSIIDLRFDEVFTKTVQSHPKQQNYMPFKITKVLMNVNTVRNKHYYYSVLYRPVNLIFKNCYDKKKLQDEEYVIVESLFEYRKDMSDTDLVKTYEEFSKKNWRLIDLKGYKDENSVTRFSTIWTCYESFYEGTSQLLIGLSKCELISKIEELKLRKLYPKFIANYGYIDIKGEHVYAAYFSQE